MKLQLALSIVHWLAGLVVLAEALNKVERADLFGGRKGVWPRIVGFAWLLMPWRWHRVHVVGVLKVLGWVVMSIGAGGAVLTPFLSEMLPPSLQDVAVIAGFALLVVRSRVKEG